MPLPLIALDPCIRAVSALSRHPTFCASAFATSLANYNPPGIALRAKSFGRELLVCPITNFSFQQFKLNRHVAMSTLLQSVRRIDRFSSDLFKQRNRTPVHRRVSSIFRRQISSPIQRDNFAHVNRERWRWYQTFDRPGNRWYPRLRSMSMSDVTTSRNTISSRICSLVVARRLVAPPRPR